MGLRLRVKVKLYTPFWVVNFFIKGGFFRIASYPSNLKSFHFSSYKNAERIQSVLKNNRNTLTFVGILIWDSKHLYKEVLNLSKLEKLITNTVGDKAFVEFFEKLAINCHKLRKIRITFDYLSKEMTDWNHFMPSFNAINRLKSFKLIHKSSSECDT